MTGLQEGSFLHSGRGQRTGCSMQGKLGMRGWLSHSCVFGLVFFTEQKLLCQLPGKPLCNYCAASGQVRSSCTRTEGGGREAQV